MSTLIPVDTIIGRIYPIFGAVLLIGSAAMLVATTLMACTVWLLRAGKGWRCVITLLPGMFYTTVVTSFILWTSTEKGQPWGFGLPMPVAVSCGAAVALAFAAYVLRRIPQGQSPCAG